METRWTLARLERGFSPFQPDALPSIDLHISYKEIEYVPGDEQAVTALYRAYSKFLDKYGNKPAFIVVGRSTYERYVAYSSYVSRGFVIPTVFMNVPLVVVEADIIEAVDTHKEMLARD